MSDEITPQVPGDSERLDPASITANVESQPVAIPDATAPAVIVNVGVNETAESVADVEDALAETQEVIAPTEDAIASAADDATEVAAETGNVVADEVADIEVPEPTELESLQIDRERAALETTELQNERLAIENDAMRSDLERRAEDTVQQIEVTPDGRSTETTSPEGKRSSGSGTTDEGTAAATSAASGDSSAESKAGSGDRSSGRDLRSKRFKRGR